MDFWTELHKLYKTNFRLRDHVCRFYYKPYLKEIIANLKYMFVTNDVFGLLLWVTHFYIGDLDFYIYFNGDYEIDFNKSIMDQILIPETSIDCIKKLITEYDDVYLSKSLQKIELGWILLKD